MKFTSESRAYARRRKYRFCGQRFCVMPLIIYVVTVSIFLLGSLLGLSAVLAPVDGIPNMRLGMPAKSVATTAEEMKTQAREDAASVEAAMRQRNPPQAVTAADLSAASAAAKIQRNAEATPRPASKKKWHTARSHQRQKGEQSYAQGPPHQFGWLFGGVAD